MELDKNLLYQLEAYTKAGETKKVIAVLDTLSPKKIPRAYAASIAKICFRNSLYLYSLRVLDSIINAEVKLSIEPQPDEIIAYAIALVSLNMNTEARKHLKKIDKELFPDALLFESFSYFGEWNYEKTIPLLKKFSSNPRVSYYRQIVGKVNLIAAYVLCARLVEAEELLLEVLQVCKEKGYLLLLGNSLELYAQLEIQNKNYRKALEYLEEAKKVLNDTNSIYYFFIRKWESICRLLLSPQDPKYVYQCQQLKEEALKWRHWETSRDIDLYVAFSTHDDELLQKLLFGTKSNHFLKKMKKLFGREFVPNKKYLLKGKGFINVNEFKTISFQECVSLLEGKPLLTKLFIVLTSDFYKPSNFGQLFSKLFPDEKFNPYTSRKRVINLIYSLKKELNKKEINFIIKKDKMDFIFEVNYGINLLYERRGHRSHFAPSLKERLMQLKSRTFTSLELSKVLNCSRRKAQMTIKKLSEENFIVILGKGSKTSYKLKAAC